MVNPYNNPNAYIQSGMPIYSEPQKQSSAPVGVVGLGFGAIGGGFLGGRKNPYMNKKFIASDAFTKKVHEKLLESGKETDRNLYKRTLEIIKELDNVKTIEELKALKTNGSNIITTNLDHVKPENLAENIKTIKNSLTSNVSSWYQETKNLIASAWNADSKKFIKPESMSDDVFDAIKKSTKGLKAKVIAKYAGVGALITGTVAVILHKILTFKSAQKVALENSQQMQY